jgi:malonyl CoA-acyl carrier protein transacylase
MFPGQPLSHVSQLPDDADFQEIARMTGERTGLDLYTLSWRGGEGSDNVRLQVYGAAMSLHRNRQLTRGGIRPGIIAEHSMGIYAALAASGSVGEGEALELVQRIGACMATMGENERYALGCVVGLTADNNGVHPANLNTSRHFLLSGLASSMDAAMDEALAAGAFSAQSFPCDAPLHSPLMEELSRPLTEICGEYRYREPEVPILEHVGQTRLNAAGIAPFLVRELSLPVYWERSFLKLRSSGVGKFFEVGSGDALKKYNRWIDGEYRMG